MGLTALLVQAGRPEAEVRKFVDQLARDWKLVTVEPVERAMLAYAHKLTVAPGSVGDPDIAALRAAGLSDRAIHDLCAITAYFAFVNRLADGLGVRLEPRFGGSPDKP